MEGIKDRNSKADMETDGVNDQRMDSGNGMIEGKGLKVSNKSRKQKQAASGLLGIKVGQKMEVLGLGTGSNSKGRVSGPGRKMEGNGNSLSVLDPNCHSVVTLKENWSPNVASVKSVNANESLGIKNLLPLQSFPESVKKNIPEGNMKSGEGSGESFFAEMGETISMEMAVNGLIRSLDVGVVNVGDPKECDPHEASKEPVGDDGQIVEDRSACMEVTQ